MGTGSSGSLQCNTKILKQNQKDKGGHADCDTRSSTKHDIQIQKFAEMQWQYMGPVYGNIWDQAMQFNVTQFRNEDIEFTDL